MNFGAQTVSALVHGGVLLAVVVFVKTEPRLPTSITAFITGEEEAKPPPPPPPPKPQAPEPAKAAAPRAMARAAAPPPAAAPSPAAQGAQAPVMDLGLMAEDDGSAISEDAVVVPVAAPASAAPAKAAPPPPPVAARPECTEELVPPEPLARVDVDYPPSLGGLDGRVVARAAVSPQGEVTAVEIVAGLDPALDEAVRASLLRWRFKPAQRCKKAVLGSFTLGLKFEASD